MPVAEATLVWIEDPNRAHSRLVHLLILIWEDHDLAHIPLLMRSEEAYIFNNDIPDFRQLFPADDVAEIASHAWNWSEKLWNCVTG